MNLIKLILLFSTLYLLSCTQDKSAIYTSKYAYKGEIQIPIKDPSRLLSNDFLITNDKDDHSKYQVIFDKVSKISIVVDRTSHDTIFEGYCYKDKEIFYFQHFVTDSTFLLSPIKIKNDTMIGWVTQTNSLFFDSVCEELGTQIENTNSKNRIIANKENIRKISNLYLEKHAIKVNFVKQKAKTYNPNRRAIFGGKNVIKNINPNMEENYIDVTVKNKGDYSIDLYNENGPIAKTLTVKQTDFIHIDVSDLKEGFYFMEINAIDTGELLVKSKIYVDSE